MHHLHHREQKPIWLPPPPPPVFSESCRWKRHAPRPRPRPRLRPVPVLRNVLVPVFCFAFIFCVRNKGRGFFLPSWPLSLSPDLFFSGGFPCPNDQFFFVFFRNTAVCCFLFHLVPGIIRSSMLVVCFLFVFFLLVANKPQRR